MVFSSLIFLLGFLPAFLLVYFFVPKDWRNGAIVLASLIFYAWAEPLFLPILLAASVFTYALGNLIASGSTLPEKRGRKRWFLVAALILVLGLLGWFKYANFTSALINEFLMRLGRRPFDWTAIALPAGISFFTFQKISYLVDVYRGTTRPARSFGDFLVYVLFFPQLIAGPIVRYHEIAHQIAEREVDDSRISRGLFRLCQGLASKVLIANPLGDTADQIFSLPMEQWSTAYAWLGLSSYTLQIYFDFSGYSAMAIGIAHMVGFDFPENFNRPYLSRSVTEFWRRWHMTLGSFMREYAYVPLGGNRHGKARTALNLWIVFLVSGLWHGAATTFVIWGACHGLLITGERLLGEKRLERIPNLFRHAYTLAFVSFAWMFFRLDSVGSAVRFLGCLLPHPSPPFSIQANPLDILPVRTAFVLGFGLVASLLPPRLLPSPGPIGRHWLAAAAFILCLASLASQSYNPFIYFRF